jgi:hypothetical protein
VRTPLTILLAVVLLSPLAAGATDVSGPVSGVWDQAGSPYYVVGDAWVPADDTLIIMPGVEVLFYATYKLSVLDNAILYAVGTKQDSILFSTPFHDEGWQGIRFLYANDLSQLSYCRLEYGRAVGSGDDRSGGAIFINVCSPTISHNSIDSCYAEEWGGGTTVTPPTPPSATTT